MQRNQIAVRCAVCNKPVDEVLVSQNYYMDAVTVEARCHGDKDTCLIPEMLLADLDKAAMEQMLQTGVAFANRLTKQLYVKDMNNAA